MGDLSWVRVVGPLEPFADGFAAELARQGYTPNSARLQMGLVAHLSRWLAAEGHGVAALGGVAIEAFLVSRRDAGYTSHLSGRALAPLLAYLRGLGVAVAVAVASAVGPVEVLLGRYRRYLEVERGLVCDAARGYVDKVRPFLDGRVGADGLDLADLDAAEVIAFVVARCPQLGSSSAKLTVVALRSLLVYLHVEGQISRPLAGAVPSVASWRLAGLPKGLEPAEVRSLLASCDRETANGRRDFAILTVLVRLGLRSGEVAALGLDDVDWRAGEIVVQGKGRRSERLPLPADVGEAMAAYLHDGRPVGALGRAVFVRVKAPWRALTGGGVGQVVAAASRRAGLGEIHAHRLRHTAATEMLRAGASLPEVGQVLRHRSHLATSVYAKVDDNALRVLARPWPGGAV
jgi:site-specific recombinase XerD